MRKFSLREKTIKNGKLSFDVPLHVFNDFFAPAKNTTLIPYSLLLIYPLFSEPTDNTISYCFHQRERSAIPCADGAGVDDAHRAAV